MTKGTAAQTNGLEEIAMRQGTIRQAVIAGIVLGCAAAPSPAAEAWADRNLTVTDGLEVWLDAAGQNPARRTLKKADNANGQKVDVWYDASGHARHLIQKDDAAQPFFQSGDGYSALRFDGTGSYLALSGLGKAYHHLTVFVVAAPFSNEGMFRAFLAMNQDGKNDYFTGVTIDQGAGPTKRFESLNVEGAGFGGAANLLRGASDFGTFQRLCVTSRVGEGGTKLFVNGKATGQRSRRDSVIHMDRLTVGGRFYTNGGPPQVRGFLEGDIAEVLIYNRVLSDAERAAVNKYLAAKHGESRKISVPARFTVGKPLVRVSDPPPVQMFVPGFTVRPLPVDLTNINNIQYRADGKLVALAYDGNVYLLSDSKGDGLEDKVEWFWDNQGRIRAPIGMALTPPGYKHGDGLFVASKGKCSLIVDTTGKGKADKEIAIAKGWQELPHWVDALGVAFDSKDGSVYFGLGTAAFDKPYQIDREGKAQYRLTSERGTILRVSPDFKSREVVCTGIRFPVGMRFNRVGDLFCTDQEGATWLPNGNPFDELLHIEKGRHYGFPPRHPVHLPKVIDEPSVFDYGPQHQSTCGLNFNESVNGGPVFGPEWWQSDAFIAGYSRGKLYRTKLVKTRAGYVAQNQLLASLNMLAVDACVSPKGELVVAVHGGGPDWGNGPKGKGKLYKITYTGKNLPQPVLAWAQGPREVRVAFDRPLDPDHLRDPTHGAAIEYGKYVSAGDRFEYHRPGYQVVQDQARAPRFDLPVLGVQVTGDRRTLILVTAPHPEAGNYALMLPGLGRPAKVNEAKRELPQSPQTDLCYDLAGVETVWRGEKGDASWAGWLPHFDLTAARHMTVASAAHQELWALCRQPGKLTLRSKLNLWDMLRPAVQPGSRLDHTPPAEEVTLIFHGSSGLEVKHAGKVAPSAVDTEGHRLVRVTLKPASDEPIPFDVTLPTGRDVPELSVSYRTHEDLRPRALQLHRFLLPWATTKKDATAEMVDRDVPELKDGNWERGRQVFFSEQATCARCHTFNGQGGAIGPDLSNLPQRDYRSVLRDITEPSFAINPDYITQLVHLKDGVVLKGSVRTQGNQLLIGGEDGRVTTIARADVEAMRPSPKSIMPEGLAKVLGPEKMRDLLTFLLTEAPRMPDYGKGTPPSPRSLREVKAVLAGAPEKLKTRPIHVVLVAGKKDHGPGEHDYPAWQKVWQKLLAMAKDTKVTTASDWPSAADMKSADVLVFYQQGKWTPERAKDIDAFLARGGGLVYLHFAVDGGKDAPGFAQRIGLAWSGGQSRFRHGPLDLGFQAGKTHPIARNFGKVHFHDESYWRLTGDAKKITLLATAAEDGQEQPMFWTLEPAKGRVFVSIPGHFAWTFDDPLFRTLLLRGIAWTAKEPVDRFNDLVTPGARIKD